MIKLNHCVSCSNKLRNFANFGSFPYLNFATDNKVLKNFLKKKRIRKIKDNLNLEFCNRCDYISISKVPSNKIIETIYSKFYRHPSPMLEKFNPSRDIFFLKKLLSYKNIIKYNKVLEIGCFDGFILNKLKQKKFNVYGCEPSDGANIAKKFGIKVKKNFFSKKLFINKKFDLIILRHTLEHIENVNKFLKEIFHVMNDKSIFVIEVPNLRFYLNRGLLEVFSFQHIHYFSIKTFRELAVKLNLKILSATETPENIIIFFKKNHISRYKKVNKNTVKFKDFKKKIISNKFLLNKIISKFELKEIIYWGAGGFAVAAMNLYKFPFNKDTVIIDKDKNKHGLSFSDINLDIVPFSKKNFQNKKLIIITSYYSKEIIKKIKSCKVNINVLQIFPKIKLLKFHG